jgi:serine/threonine-protein kinase
VEVGELLGGRYRLTEPIGAGGMGEVWRATDTVLGRTVAVKILRPDLSVDSSFGARFRAEAHTLATLHHPGVVDVYDYGEINVADGGADRATASLATEVAYVVMAYVEGQPLSRRIEHAGRLSPATTMSIVAQVADALQAAHAAGVVHRDVKPDNILINTDGRAVLVDFGVAHTSTTQGLTGVQDVIGTALYMAPEQAMKHAITPATDVYALASVAYECLTGVPPFTGDTPVSVALAHVHGVPAPLPDDIPPAVRDVITTGMAKNPGQRFTSAAAMATAARRAATAADGRRSPDGTVVPLPAGRANVPVRQPTMRLASPAAWAADVATFEAPDRANPRAPRARRRGLFAAATLAAVALAAVLVAMTHPGLIPGDPSVVQPGTSTNSPGAHQSTARTGTVTTSPGAPGATGSSTVTRRAPGPTATKTGKPTSSPTSNPTISIPPLPSPSLPLPTTGGALPSTPPAGGGSAPAAG